MIVDGIIGITIVVIVAVADMISRLLGFIGLNKLLLVAVLASSAASAFATWHILDWKHGKEIAEMQNLAYQAAIQSMNDKNEIDYYNGQVAKAQAEAYEAKNREREVITKYVTKEVIKYVQSDDAGKCDLPDQWVYLHDTAARGSLPRDTDTASEPNGDTGRITDIEVLGVVTENYQSCHKIRDQLIGLQEWAKGISCKAPE